jgi:hypothetical protein
MKNTNTTPVVKSTEVSLNSAPVSTVASFEDYYLKKDYKGAANFLLQNKQQMNSGIFHYNLGTVYSKLSDYPAARFHMEKAIKEGFVNSASINNLAFIKAQLQVDDLSTSTQIQDQFMNSALAIPSTAYLSASLVFLLLFLFLIKTRKLVKRLSIVFMVVLIIAPITFSHIYLDKINYAVAFKDIPLYEGPSKIFAEKGKIKAGSKIILGEFKEGWFYVKFPISLTGWTSKDQLGLY